MQRRSVLRMLVCASFAFAARPPAAWAQSPGYLWLKDFSASAVGSGGDLRLAGSFTNDCSGGLPSGSILRIYFDKAVLLNVQITAGPGQSQDFSTTITVPQIPPPPNDTTAYRFAVFVPGVAPAGGTQAAQPDMKTSPCLVTGVPGNP